MGFPFFAISWPFVLLFTCILKAQQQKEAMASGLQACRLSATARSSAQRVGKAAPGQERGQHKGVGRKNEAWGQEMRGRSTLRLSQAAARL